MGRAVLIVLALGACGRFGFDDMATDADAGGDGGSGANVAHITIEHTGSASGTVVGPSGLTCATGTCTLDVPPGTTVTLRGLAAADAWFAGWTGPCGGNFECTFQASGDLTLYAEFTPPPNRVFVTSTTVDGGLGGIAAADAVCAARATAAGLSGMFVAFLSDSSTNATSRLATSRGWIRTDGAPFADAPTAFTTGKIVFPPRLDEYGNDLGNVRIYTGTSFGAITANTCSDWTTNVGTQMGGATYSQYASSSVGAGNSACSNLAHLMCVEIGRVQPVQIHPDTGKLAFSTKTPWVPGGGRGSADALCASEASAAGLPGTFLAAVATTTESIASRFPAGDIYRRIDGVRLLRTGGLFAADWLDMPPELDQLGARVDRDLWTGASRLDVVALPADNCSDWTVGTAAQDGIMHFTTFTDVRTPAKTDLCDSPVSLLCLQHD